MKIMELLVRLKIPDVTALTAANALRRNMGYTQLKQLRRADYYCFALNVATDEEAEALVRELAEKTNLFVNPNKHVYEIMRQHEAGAANAGHIVHVLVTDPHDGSAEGMLQALQGRLGYGERVQGLTKGQLWTLVLETSHADEARRVAQEIAETKSLERGLLVNPHFQDYEIW